MARCLIIGCGCRGQMLARGLHERGHLVRGTTRSPARGPAIEATGAQALIADPDRIGTLRPGLDHVSVACVLLASAEGTAEEIAALHGARLEALLLNVIDTTVHGVLYEAVGSVEQSILDAGAELVRASCELSRIPFALLERDPPAGYDAWFTAAVGAVDQVLSAS
ncbi:MAG: hypothetical protein ACLP8S_33680 [Solirubrobacteraceae bacterium]